MHNFAPFMVASSTDGESRSIYGGVYMVEGYNKGYFIQHGWQRDAHIDSPSPTHFKSSKAWSASSVHSNFSGFFFSKLKMDKKLLYQRISG
jgi:hypothetical protein